MFKTPLRSRSVQAKPMRQEAPANIVGFNASQVGWATVFQWFQVWARDTSQSNYMDSPCSLSIPTVPRNNQTSFAGQMTGVEGYVDQLPQACCWINAARLFKGEEAYFQKRQLSKVWLTILPMPIAFPTHECQLWIITEGYCIRDKSERYEKIAERS